MADAPTGLAMSGGNVGDAAKAESSRSKKKPFEQEYHGVVAKELLDITSRMRAIRERIIESYAKSTPVARQSEAVINMLTSLRAELNARFMVERKDSQYTNKTPYYPDAPAPAAANPNPDKPVIPAEPKSPELPPQSAVSAGDVDDMFGSGEGEG